MKTSEEQTKQLGGQDTCPSTEVNNEIKKEKENQPEETIPGSFNDC